MVSHYILALADITVEEIDNLKKEAAAFREVRRMLGEEDGAERVFRKVSCEMCFVS